jgi:hypothetical protein
MGGGGNNNRRPMMPNRNQTFDSNGPDVRIRGSAYQVHEKYMNLAQDATAAGDRIMAESYYQHAEHYYRIINAQEYGPDGQRRRYDGPNNENGYGQQSQGGDEPQPDLNGEGNSDEGQDEQNGRQAEGEDGRQENDQGRHNQAQMRHDQHQAPQDQAGQRGEEETQDAGQPY